MIASILRGTAILVVACWLPTASGQVSEVVAAEDEAAIEQRAQRVESRVVEEYGSEAQRYAFAHPHTVPPGVKRPKFPKNPQGPEDMAEWMDYLVYSMEPEQIFLTVFQLGLYERYLKGSLRGETQEDRMRQRAIGLAGAAANQATQGLAFVPGGAFVQPIVSMAIEEVAKRAMEKERASEEERQAAAEGLALSAGLNSFLKRRLSVEEMSQYTTANAGGKAARLLLITEQMLKDQGLPSAYVIVATEQMERSPMRGGTDLEQMRAMFGDDPRFGEATWKGLSRAQRWRAVTDGMVGLLEEGQASMSEPQSAEAFLVKLHFPADRSGSSAVLGTFGPSALPLYRKASPEEKRRMELDARVIHAASELLARVSMGAEAGQVSAGSG